MTAGCIVLTRDEWSGHQAGSREFYSPTESPLGQDGMLYLNETVTGNIYRYAWRDGAMVGPRTLFGNVISGGCSARVERTGWYGL